MAHCKARPIDPDGLRAQARDKRGSDLLSAPELTLLAIAFPNVNPVLLELGPLSIHWYGIGYVAGIMFAWWYGKRLIGSMRLWRDTIPPMTDLDLDDFLLWAALGVVLGGRIGHILFYDFAQYAGDPLTVFHVWKGGMSFHGGFLGMVLAMILFARRRGINVWSLFDTIACAAPVGLGLVRIANFINSELWGRVTDVPWAVIFPNGGPDGRHPSQLYEALLEGLVLFLALRFLSHSRFKLRAPGFIAGAFVVIYGLSRIAVELVREPDAQLGFLAGGWLTMGMLLSVPMVLAGVWAMLRAK
jgi:phosphatidylglycerol---prolipoprotein diacylglyceryl transferase